MKTKKSSMNGDEAGRVPNDGDITTQTVESPRPTQAAGETVTSVPEGNGPPAAPPQPDDEHRRSLPLIESEPSDTTHIAVGGKPPFPRNDSDNGAEPGESTQGTQAKAALDPFDPARLRLPQEFTVATGAKRVQTTVPVRKPSKEVFVRTHPDQTYRIVAAILELKEDREVFLVHPDLLEALAGESTVSPRLLVTTITRQKALSLWPLRLPGPDGRLDDYGRSALEIAEVAKDRWVRVIANTGGGYYDHIEAPPSLEPPEWPTTPFSELLRVGFRDRFITNLEHPVLRRLRGEV
jgi:hypothetical protein